MAWRRGMMVLSAIRRGSGQQARQYSFLWAQASYPISPWCEASSRRELGYTCLSKTCHVYRSRFAVILEVKQSGTGM
ncbi:hypothetical protein B0H63DRAFT_484370 [Podospora didyma]|uniref:Uncharacterized protein n=1 Tax=Podospora didyma TaxID=330526 RepID=A0AAE0N6B9_9PEZI|nr:hypothetical protein B0H63DRAFT_484370 [Podospora didyma]